MVKGLDKISKHYWEYEFKDRVAKITQYTPTGKVDEPYPSSVRDLVSHQRYDG
jgi:hypothetical protein